MIQVDNNKGITMANIKPETNKFYSDIYSDEFIYIDRMYIDNHLVQKNGSIYEGHIKNYKVKGCEKPFHLTEDGRWFDNSGMPCNVPVGFDHIKKIWEVKNEGKKLKADKQFKEYKNKVFKKGVR